MSGAVGTPSARKSAGSTAAAWRRLFRDRPIIPLLGLLGLLVVARSSSPGPGIVNAELGRRRSCAPPSRWRSSPAARR